MKYVVEGRKPEKLFRYFEDLCRIPHGSGNEAAVAEWIERFARERGLFCLRDEWNNVFVRLPATPGREKEDAVLLQGHTDMVCEKNGDTVHDFLSDPLDLAVENGQLFARGTTLGADDGVAVAAMLTVLDGGLASHPTLECLFTTSEETGLVGAYQFDYSQITARSMINMDSEALGEVTAGCAGGVRSDIEMPISLIGVEGRTLTVQIKGLCGGHSGECIHLGRANANKVMGRMLLALHREHPFYLLSVDGGNKDNAIPRECTARLISADAEASVDYLQRLADDFRAELVDEDKNFSLTVSMADDDGEHKAFGAFCTRNILAFLANVSVGVLSMSHDVPGLVEFSRNLGVVKTEGKAVHFVFSSRSAIEGQLENSIAMFDAFADLIGATTKHYSRYPGWVYDRESAMREKYLAAYRAVTGKEARVIVLHAGLECGIIKSHLPYMDAISIGPDMSGIHSPDEKLDLASFEIFWKTIEETLK